LELSRESSTISSRIRKEVYGLSPEAFE